MGLVLVCVLAGCGDNLGAGDDDGDATSAADGAPGDGGGGADGSSDASLTPFVVSTIPAPGAIDVGAGARVHATFSRAMNPATITELTFTLRQGATPVAGVVSYDEATTTATFAPAAALERSRPYTATVTAGATDAAGVAMAGDHPWSFDTGACTQTTVPLLTAGGFAVLAGSTVTNTGLTTVTGDLGVSAGTSVTGFPPGVLVGTRHAGTAAAAQAQLDLTVAYNDAAGRVLCPVAVAGNLGGRTLPPGLYKSTSSIAITSGDLTLDAGGDPSAIFIFQSATTLSTSAGRRVILTGGALAGNVFWQVGTSADFGTTTAFHGTVMADQSITFGTGATLNGRALARIALVSMQANTIVRP